MTDVQGDAPIVVRHDLTLPPPCASSGVIPQHWRSPGDSPLTLHCDSRIAERNQPKKAGRASRIAPETGNPSANRTAAKTVRTATAASAPRLVSPRKGRSASLTRSW